MTTPHVLVPLLEGFEEIEAITTETTKSSILFTMVREALKNSRGYAPLPPAPCF